MKNHYLLRHSDTIPQTPTKLSQSSTPIKREAENTPATSNKKKATGPPRNYKIEIVGDIDEEDILSSASGNNKKRGRRSTGVKRKRSQ